MREIWKDVPKKRYFQVSNLGRVRRLEMKDTMGRTWKEKLVKHQNGRCNGGEVARMILSAFDRLPNKGEMARHLDDNRENNCLLNLAWGYRQDNVDDAVRNGIYGKGTASARKIGEGVSRHWKNISAEERKMKSELNRARITKAWQDKNFKKKIRIARTEQARSRLRVSGRWI